MSRTPEVIRKKIAEFLPSKVYGAGVISGLVSWGAFTNNADDVGFLAAVIPVGLFWMGSKINPVTHFRVKQWNPLTMKLRALSPLLTVPLLLFTPLPSHAADPIQSWVSRYDVTSGENRAVGIAYDSAGNSYVTGYSQNGGIYYDWNTIKYGPTGNRLWIKTYNDPGGKSETPAAIAVNSAGQVYVTGSSYSVSSYSDIVTIKYDTNGNVLWSKTYNNSAYNYIDYPTALAIDKSDNVYVTGVSSNGPSFGVDDYITIKYNASGTQLWAKRYNGSNNGNDYPTAIAVDVAGNVAVTGYSDGGATNYDYATIKYTTNGTQSWVKRYTGINSTNGYNDRARGIAFDNNGNVIVTGQSGSASSGSTTGDFATIKYSSSGTQLWLRRFNGSALGEDDAKALAVDTLGNIYVTGWSNSASPRSGVQFGLPAYATVKYSPSGTQLWNRLYRGPGFIDRATAIALDSTGNVYITGSSRGASGNSDDYATVKYNASGAQQWAMRYNGLVTIYTQYDVPAGIAVDPANNIYVTGYSDGGSTYYDYVTIKYSQP